MVRVLEDLAADWRRLDERIERLSSEIEHLARRDAGCERLMSVPGVGPIVSSAMVAAIGAGEVFSKGRDFASWLGLVPKQISTGDRTDSAGGGSYFEGGPSGHAAARPCPIGQPQPTVRPAGRLEHRSSMMGGRLDRAFRGACHETHRYLEIHSQYLERTLIRSLRAPLAFSIPSAKITSALPSGNGLLRRAAAAG